MKQAAICIIHDQLNSDFVHMLRRTASDKIAPGMFCFPGGKLEVGETFKDACIREVFEETAFKLSPDHMEHIDTVTIGEYETAVFRCWSYQGPRWARVSAEHDSATLISWDDYNNHPLVGAATWDVLTSYRSKMNQDKQFRDTVYPGVKDIIIDTMIPARAPRETFEVIVNWYSGDGDAPSTTTAMVPLADKDKLIQTLNDIQIICGTDAMYNCTSEWSDEHKEVYYNTLIEWPSDVFTDGEGAAHIDGIEIFYYNDRGDKHTCMVKER